MHLQLTAFCTLFWERVCLCVLPAAHLFSLCPLELWSEGKFALFDFRTESSSPRQGLSFLPRYKVSEKGKTAVLSWKRKGRRRGLKQTSKCCVSVEVYVRRASSGGDFPSSGHLWSWCNFHKLLRMYSRLTCSGGGQPSAVCAYSQVGYIPVICSLRILWGWFPEPYPSEYCRYSDVQ